MKETTSPDGRHVATAFIRECGATTAQSPQVYLRASGDPAGQTGNVFIGDRSRQIDIVWQSPTHLLITCDGRTILHQRSYQGITIEKRTTR